MHMILEAEICNWRAGDPGVSMCSVSLSLKAQGPGQPKVQAQVVELMLQLESKG